MLWLKAFHIVFVVTWFAGLFYLPRLFVYAAQNPAGEAHAVLLTMQRKLLIMTHIAAALAAGFGVSMLIMQPAYLQWGWMHAKLTLVLLLIGYHFWCAHLAGAFRAGNNRRSEKWYRWFNEVPALFLIAIVILAVVEPF